jgi:hypothetical protein
MDKITSDDICIYDCMMSFQLGFLDGCAETDTCHSALGLVDQSKHDPNYQAEMSLNFYL